MTERLCVCARACLCIYDTGVRTPWQKLLRLTAGTVSLLHKDEMCEMRDATQTDPYMLRT